MVLALIGYPCVGHLFLHPNIDNVINETNRRKHLSLTMSDFTLTYYRSREYSIVMCSIPMIFLFVWLFLVCSMISWLTCSPHYGVYHTSWNTLPSNWLLLWQVYLWDFSLVSLGCGNCICFCTVAAAAEINYSDTIQANSHSLPLFFCCWRWEMFLLFRLKLFSWKTVLMNLERPATVFWDNLMGYHYF